MASDSKRPCLEVDRGVEDRGVEDESYFKSYADLGIHEEMISDRVRTVTYRLAILKNYDFIRGKVVADIGAGTGILSMFCVQAGAKKVYAIEASGLAVHTRRVVEENKMSDKITVINLKVEDVKVPEKVDVIVSEWMGYCLLYENMLPSVLYARDNWLRKGGVVLPSSADIYIAPLTDAEYYNERLSFWDRVDDEYDVNMSSLKSVAVDSLTRGVHVFSAEPQDIVAHAVRVKHLDLSDITAEELRCVQGEFTLSCFGRSEVHGFVLWFDVHFPKDITLTTSPYKRETHWQQCVVYVSDPFMVEQDTAISGNLCLAPNTKSNRLLDVTLRYKVGDKKPVEKTYCLM